MKRKYSSDSSQASFVTADSQVLESQLTSEPQRAPFSLNRAVSPPLPSRKKTTVQPQKSTTAAVEAGEVDVEDHVSFFSEKLLAARLPNTPGSPRLDHSEWLNLYRRNLTDKGRHFVIHQHDHPVAGTHYDLRLQCNATSSISFAIMYGMPGDPNSRKLARNATETRVHNLWNHLIETASHETGSMLIWDTGEYVVLPYYEENQQNRESTPDSASESGSQTTNTTTIGGFSTLSEPEKLASSFARRKIRLRLHGTRLPPGYTIGMRLTMDNYRSTQPKAPNFKRGRKPAHPSQQTSALRPRRDSTPSHSSSSSRPSPPRHPTHRALTRNVSSLHRTASPPIRSPKSEPNADLKPPSEPEPQIRQQNKSHNPSHNPQNDTTSSPSPSPSYHSSSDETTKIQTTNAYPGALNTINSIHQRKWYLSLDRRRSGFVQIPTPKGVMHHAKTYWIMGGEGSKEEVRGGREGQHGEKKGFEKFHVLGRDVERSVVTGRLASDILRDEGVEGYVPRGRWRGVTT